MNYFEDDLQLIPFNAVTGIVKLVARQALEVCTVTNDENAYYLVEDTDRFLTDYRAWLQRQDSVDEPIKESNTETPTFIPGVLDIAEKMHMPPPAVLQLIKGVAKNKDIPVEAVISQTLELLREEMQEASHA